MSIDLSKEDIGAFYQVYNNPIATEAVLCNFRKYYPNTKIYMVCDNGIDMHEIAKKYQAYYFHSPINIGIGKINFNGFKTLLTRFNNGLYYIKEKYFLLLEDDVLIRNKLWGELKSPMAGCYNHGNIIGATLAKKLNINPNYIFGGSGGTIFDKSYWMKLESEYYNILEFYKEWYENKDKIDPGFANCISCIDYILSSICYYFGGKYTRLDCLTESKRNHSWHNSNHAIVHGIKDWPII